MNEYLKDHTLEEAADMIISRIYPHLENTKFSGMSYEQGIRDCLDWLTGESNDEDFLSEYPLNS